MATDAQIEAFFKEKTGGDRSPITFLFEDAGDSVFYIKGAGMAALSVDVVDDETHTWGNEISQYPVEGEEDIADNIKPKPDELSLTCFVSNTPVHGLVDELVNFTDRFLNGRKRTADCFNQLKELKALRIPVTVTTRYRVYESVGITDVVIRREPENGEALVFDVRFREINIVATQTGTVPEGIGRPGAQSDNATKTRAGSKVDAGKSTGRVTEAGASNEPKPVAKQRSALQAIWGK